MNKSFEEKLSKLIEPPHEDYDVAIAMANAANDPDFQEFEENDFDEYALATLRERWSVIQLMVELVPERTPWKKGCRYLQASLRERQKFERWTEKAQQMSPCDIGEVEVAFGRNKSQLIGDLAEIELLRLSVVPRAKRGSLKQTKMVHAA